MPTLDRIQAVPERMSGAGADLRDAAVRWRREPAAAGHTGALDNVIAFVRRGGRGEGAPAVVAPVALRWLRPAGSRKRAMWIGALLTASAAAHVALFLPLQSEPEPMASIGEIAVSVELVLGANQHAGPVPDSGVNETSTPAQAAPQAPNATPDAPQQQPAPVKSVQVEPVQTPTVAEAKPIEAKPVRQPTEQPAEAKPQATVELKTPTVTAERVTVQTVTPVTPASEPPTQAAQIQAVTVDTAGEVLANANPLVAEVTALAAPQPTPVETLTPPVQQAERKPQEQERGLRGERNRSQAASTPSVAAGGVGRGASAADSNYRGRVAAHLSRHKRFPPEARSRGTQGHATIYFAIDPGGRVTAVNLVRPSGVASLDREVLAMVQRASPFPAPPHGKAMSFTVPVNFKLR